MENVDYADYPVLARCIVRTSDVRISTRRVRGKNPIPSAMPVSLPYPSRQAASIPRDQASRDKLTQNGGF